MAKYIVWSYSKFLLLKDVNFNNGMEKESYTLFFAKCYYSSMPNKDDVMAAFKSQALMWMHSSVVP